MRESKQKENLKQGEGTVFPCSSAPCSQGGWKFPCPASSLSLSLSLLSMSHHSKERGAGTTPHSSHLPGQVRYLQHSMLVPKRGQAAASVGQAAGPSICHAPDS